MKLGLVGCGQMGSLVESVAISRGHEVVARFDSRRPLRATEETRQRVASVEVLIDFSIGEAVPETVAAACELSTHLVIGTTGWNDRLDDIRAAVESAGIGVVFAANFSLGVHLFYRVVAAAAAALSSFDDYDVYVAEAHHRHKRDRPSGTALTLLEILGRSYGEAEIPVTSLRAGEIPGTHTVGFDSAADTVRIEHVARSRRGFAEGALRAASWVTGRQGFFGFDDVLADLEPGPVGSTA